MSYLPALLFIPSVAYLLWRTIGQVILQNRSYAALPYAENAHVGGESPFPDRAQGALLGLALGDALGMPRESLPVWLANLRFGKKPALSQGIIRFMRRPGTISDDTQLTVATARAIDDEGTYHPECFVAELTDWVSFAIGPGKATMQAARGWAQGQDRRDQRSQGNGAAMRVVPLAIAHRHDLTTFVATVGVDAEQTHPNLEAIAGAEAMGRMIIYLLNQPSESTPRASELVEATLPSSHSLELDDWIDRLSEAQNAAHQQREGALSTIGSSGWVKETVPAVLYLLLANKDDTNAGLRQLFHAGGDIDTIGALYLACVGAWKGTQVFSRDNLEALQGVQILIDEATRLSTVGQRDF